ncbi:MAG: hypothetical protein K0R99_405 [Microbacterium sp.]|uniref:hypothetical protein n=1 Tax=Microbacterium sp. TaxID=51671 RepID=UPI00262B3262|nr:hypothetical protein [Microbacterium sp.]MDF2558959.1 hypothetical protein [Microbacterium sp.]
MSDHDVSPSDPDARIAEQLAERTGEDSGAAQQVPAGGAGADSGSAETVGVDPGSRASIPDESTHNDEPGIGTRRADVDEANRDDGDPGSRA